MYKKLCFTMIALALSSQASAQLVVATPDSDLIAIENQISNVATWGSQLTQLKQQLSQAQQLYNQLNGLRNVSSLLQNQLLMQNMPTNTAKTVQSLTTGNGAGSITGSLQQIQALYQNQNCAQNSNPTVAKACNQRWQTLAMNQYVGQNGFQLAVNNVTNLQQMLTKIQGTSDPKAMQDLQARYQLEKIKLDNEMLKLNMVKQMQDAADQLNRQNQGENAINTLSNSQPIHF